MCLVSGGRRRQVRREFKRLVVMPNEKVYHRGREISLEALREIDELRCSDEECCFRSSCTGSPCYLTQEQVES